MTRSQITGRPFGLASALAVPATLILALAGCGSDQNLDPGDEESSTQESAPPESGAGESNGTESGAAESESPAPSTAEDSPSDEPATDDESSASGSASGGPDSEDGLFAGYRAAQEESPEGTIVGFGMENGALEWTVIDGTTDLEITTDPDSGEVTGTREDGTADGDDVAEAESIEVSLEDALRTAQDDRGEAAVEADIDSDDGTLAWTVEFADDTETTVDATTGEIVSRDG